jgi:hypothetical protein
MGGVTLSLGVLAGAERGVRRSCGYQRDQRGPGQPKRLVACRTGCACMSAPGTGLILIGDTGLAYKESTTS